LRLLLIAVVTVLFAGCGGVGNGNRIVSLKVVNGDNLGTINEPLVTYQCLRQSVHLLATFLNGEVGDYTTRVKWSSSDDNIVHVSNADKDVFGDLVPSESAAGLVYAAGTLIPGRVTGTAIITGTYVGLSASVAVQVKTPNSMFISKDDLLTPVSSLTIAPKSIQTLRVLSDLDGTGVPSDISAFVLWSLPGDPNGTTATINSSGVLSGITANPQQITVQASFDGCPSLPAGVNILSSNNGQLQSLLTVSELDHLTLSSEQDSNSQFTSLTGGQLFVGTSEATTLLGYFSPGNSGPSQDLSFQSQFYADYSQDCPNMNVVPTPTQTNVPVELGFSLVQGFNNVVSSLLASTTPVKLSASFGVAPEAICATNDITRTATDGILDHIDIRADQKSLTIAPGAIQQYNAIGTFVDINGNLVGTQDITRHVTWSVDNKNEASISNSYNTAGKLGTLRQPGCVNVIAAINSAHGPVSDTTPLYIGTAGSPATACLPPPPVNR
jgi:hypothetical protein